MKTLAVIPARAGSKGIRRKNFRFFDGKPLLFEIIETALNSSLIDDIVLTTDDSEFSEVLEQTKIKVRLRPPELCEDHITLDPVVIDAVNWYEKNFGRVDIVITLQPTTPLIKVRTIDDAISHFINSNFDTVVSCVPEEHLTWKVEDEKFIPEFEERLNRQYLNRRYKETGAFVICKRENLERGSRFGSNVRLLEISQEEAVDIDSEVDWYVALCLKRRPKFLFVVIGDIDHGTGHIYRTLTLHSYLTGYEKKVLVYKASEQAEKLFRNNGIDYVKISNLSDVLSVCRLDNFQIVINDILDTDEWYIRELNSLELFVVNFEDLGEGAEFANLVFNALYERNFPPPNHKYGAEFCDLPISFILEKPNEFSEDLRTILVTFGGVDQNNLTCKTLEVLDKVIGKDIKVKVIVGPSYIYDKELSELLNRTNLDWIIVRNVQNMAKEMKGVDLAISSNGRTIYELAAMRVPTISIAQNDRETLHLFARYCKGIDYIGIACKGFEEKLEKSLRKLIESKNRRQMYIELAKLDLRKGIRNIIQTLFIEYERWRYEKSTDWKSYYKL